MDDSACFLEKAPWQTRSHIARPFVRHPNLQPHPVQIRHYRPSKAEAVLSVIIPTSDAWRNGYFPKLLKQIPSQTFHNFELIVVRGDPRQGRAINIGAALAEGKYLLTLDDDTSLPDPETFRKLVTTMEENPDIGIAGGNNVIPQDALPVVRKVMEQLPRRSWKVVEEITDSDLAEHPCMIMRAEPFRAVGGENELLPRGLDPYLRQAFREAGWRVVVVPSVVYHHLPPDNYRKLVRQFYRNGRQAAFVNHHFPHWVIETPAEHGSFTPRIPLYKRILRFPIRLMGALASGRLIWLLCETAYALGFMKEWLLPSKNA